MDTDTPYILTSPFPIPHSHSHLDDTRDTDGDIDLHLTAADQAEIDAHFGGGLASADVHEHDHAPVSQVPIETGQEDLQGVGIVGMSGEEYGADDGSREGQGGQGQGQLDPALMHAEDASLGGQHQHPEQPLGDAATELDNGIHEQEQQDDIDHTHDADTMDDTHPMIDAQLHDALSRVHQQAQEAEQERRQSQRQSPPTSRIERDFGHDHDHEMPPPPPGQRSRPPRGLGRDAGAYGNDEAEGDAASGSGSGSRGVADLSGYQRKQKDALMSEEEKKERLRAMNKAAAERSRNKKRKKEGAMEDTLNELRQANAALRAKLASLQAADQTSHFGLDPSLAIPGSHGETSAAGAVGSTNPGIHSADPNGQALNINPNAYSVSNRLGLDWKYITKLRSEMINTRWALVERVERARELQGLLDTKRGIRRSSHDARNPADRDAPDQNHPDESDDKPSKGAMSLNDQDLIAETRLRLLTVDIDNKIATAQERALDLCLRKLDEDRTELGQFREVLLGELRARGKLGEGEDVPGDADGLIGGSGTSRVGGVGVAASHRQGHGESGDPSVLAGATGQDAAIEDGADRDIAPGSGAGDSASTGDAEGRIHPPHVYTQNSGSGQAAQSDPQSGEHPGTGDGTDTGIVMDVDVNIDPALDSIGGDQGQAEILAQAVRAAAASAESLDSDIDPHGAAPTARAAPGDDLGVALDDVDVDMDGLDLPLHEELHSVADLTGVRAQPGGAGVGIGVGVGVGVQPVRSSGTGISGHGAVLQAQGQGQSDADVWEWD